MERRMENHRNPQRARRGRARIRRRRRAGGVTALLLLAAVLFVKNCGTHAPESAHRPAALTAPEISSSINQGDLSGAEPPGSGGGEAGAPWYLTLVNRWNPLPEDYAVDLVEIPDGQQIDSRIYEPLMDMLADAEAEGLGPVVASGYRTQEKQQSLYDERMEKYRNQGYSDAGAKEQTERWVAVPGYSEHQLGIAVDINGATYDIYLWLQANSYKYGFIFRYPGWKTEITGTAEEVWHYRYVGVEAAAEIYEQGICLEEYLEMAGSNAA